MADPKDDEDDDLKPVLPPRFADRSVEFETLWEVTPPPDEDDDKG